MFDESARGVYIIAVTPFDKRGGLDLDSTDRRSIFTWDPAPTDGKPGPRVSRETAAEIDFMLERLERATAPRPVRAAS
jgi:hypothetical protein